MSKSAPAQVFATEALSADVSFSFHEEMMLGRASFGTQSIPFALSREESRRLLASLELWLNTEDAS